MCMYVHMLIDVSLYECELLEIESLVLVVGICVRIWKFKLKVIIECLFCVLVHETLWTHGT